MARTLLDNKLVAGPSPMSESIKKHILDLYCESDKLKRPHPQTLAEFEKIHVVGKGAYGTAVLYRKKDDDSLVILKEINMHELNHIERQRALNEVKVLSMLDHPNIINYYDSFEEDGVLMIEMEYAEGGTLAQYLAQQDRELEELEILNLFHQMVAATCYLHEHNVLHRDLKTANLFLTKEGEVKLGDFGVAKLMMTGSEAHTILGTPYYISPEICEGKCYNDKSDIWSLGCILYEMACRQRTFEGTNLPAVVNKIMKGQFAPITNNYSPEFKGLVMDMLQKEPQYRPSAHELLYVRLPEMMAKYEETPVQEKGPGSGLRCGLGHKKNGRTALYYFSMSDMELCPLDGLPAKIKIRQVTVSDNHMIAVTAERAVYTWGSNLKGQLGHGDLQSRSRPQLVEALKGKFIARASCGRGFSVFISDNGIVMTSGDGAQGCLGHGDFFSTSRPCLIEALLGVNVQAAACGQQHVVCVSGDGEVFSWGNGKFGKLGLGNDDNSCLPIKVTFEEQIFIKDVKCGLDGTMFLTDTGSLLACGNNQYNKLGLNERRGLLMQMTMLFARTDVEGRKVPTVVKALRNQHVRDAVLGPSHTIVLVEPGNVFTFGRNTEGQLGTGNTKPYKMPVHVKQLQHQTISIISCGETFSVAGTDNNIILFWGTWSKLTLSPNPSASVRVCQAGTSATSVSPSPVETQDSNSGTASHKDGGKNSDDEKQLSGIESKSADEDKLDAPESSLSQKNTNWSKAGSLEQHESYTSMTSVKGKRKSKKDHTETSPESIKSERKDLQEPARSKPNTFGSESSLQEGESSQLVPVPVVSLKQNLGDCVDVCSPCLRGIICNREIIYVLVEGTDPPCHRPARRFRSFRKRGNRESTVLKQGRVLHYSHSSNEAGDEYTSSEMSELETSNFIPTWIRNELNEAMVTGARGDEKHSEVDTVTSSTKNGVDDLSPAGEINREGAKPLAEQVAGGLEMTSGNYDGAKHSSISTSGSSDGQPIPFKQKTARSKDKHGKPVQGFAVSTSQRRHYQSKMDMGPDSARICSKPVKACDRNISASPWKSGMLNTPGPGNQKSLNRPRISRGRGKSRAVWLNSETSALKNSKYYHHPAHITSPLSKNKCGTFPGEVRRKQTAEERIQSQEEEHNNLYLLEEQQRLALEREARLQTEIDKLYKELKEQKQLLKENHDVMQQLQEHLLKVQSQQFRSNVQAEPGHAVKAVTKPESKICTVM
ncbi:serine/threonine-protein kinase Nek9-like isoform X5 [Mobula hypostoma]